MEENHEENHVMMITQSQSQALDVRTSGSYQQVAHPLPTTIPQKTAGPSHSITTVASTEGTMMSVINKKPPTVEPKFKFMATLTQCWGEGGERPIRPIRQSSGKDRRNGSIRGVTPVRAHLRKKKNLEKTATKHKRRGSKYENESDEDYASRELAAALQVQENVRLMSKFRIIKKKK
jgi:hypothetical protein